MHPNFIPAIPIPTPTAVAIEATTAAAEPIYLLPTDTTTTLSPFLDMKYEPWMQPLLYVLVIFDILSFLLASWMYIEGCDAVLDRLLRRRGVAAEVEEEHMQRVLGRWQREQWVVMDAEFERDAAAREVGVEWMLTEDERVAWEAHRAVQAEMRRFGVV